MSDNGPQLFIERCFGVLVAAGKHVRHSDMQLLEMVGKIWFWHLNICVVGTIIFLGGASWFECHIAWKKLHEYLCSLGPNWVIFWTIKYGNPKRSKAVYDGCCGFSYTWYTGTCAIPNRNCSKSIWSTREKFLVFPEERPNPTVFPELKRGKWYYLFSIYCNSK